VALAAPSPFFLWLMASPWAKAMIAAEWIFPVVQSIHFIGFAFSIGTIAIVDIRLLGWGMRRQTAAELASDLNRWTNLGIAMMLITGPLMFSTDAVTYHYNPSFQFKMACLTAALLFQFTVHRWAVRDSAPAVVAGIAGAVSLVLWTAVLAGGRFIAFI
jgi:hypothetical protein